jgi:predicted small secreted protein
MAASPDASGDDTEEAFVHTERDMNMKTFTKMTVALLMGALISIGALGCNTFKGAGKDIQKGGQGIENAAEGAQHK